MATSSPNPGPGKWLRRADQVVVAVLVAVGLGSMVGWWIVHGGWQQRLVEWDRAEPQNAQFLVDVNTADWPELTQLPGVGKLLAERIVETRKTSGLFKELSDLRRVRGIGPITLKRLEPYLCPLPGTRVVADR